MRLIDADKLLVHLNDCALSASPGGGSLKKQMIARVEYDTIQNCMKAVESQPAAYDVDGVVQKLDEMKKKSLYGHAISFSDEDLGKAFGFEIAIDVVKRGGKSDE